MEAINLAGSTVGILAEDGVILAGEKKTTSKLLDQASGVAWEGCKELEGKVELVTVAGDITATSFIQPQWIETLHLWEVFQGFIMGLCKDHVIYKLPRIEVG